MSCSIHIKYTGPTLLNTHISTGYPSWCTNGTLTLWKSHDRECLTHWGPETHMHQKLGSSLIQVMACCLLGTEPLPGWDHREMFNSDRYWFDSHSRKCIQKYCLKNFSHFLERPWYQMSPIMGGPHLGVPLIDVYLFENLVSVLDTWTPNMAQHQCNHKSLMILR